MIQTKKFFVLPLAIVTAPLSVGFHLSRQVMGGVQADVAP
jgi:hypothetical protein